MMTPRVARKFLVVSLTLSVVFLGARSQAAQIYLLDFNSHTGGTSAFPGGSSAWNSYETPGNINGSVIKDITGSTAAGITLQKTGSLTDSGNTGTAAFNNSTGGPSWVTTDGSLANTGAAADYFFTSTAGASHTFTLTLAGMTQGTQVSLDLWFSRANAAGNGFFDYSLDGGTTWTGFNVLEKNGAAATANSWGTNTTGEQMFRGQQDGNDAARYMNAGNLTIGSGGSLLIRSTDDAGGGWTGISAAQLTVIPEPASSGLICGALALAMIRRRR